MREVAEVSGKLPTMAQQNNKVRTSKVRVEVLDDRITQGGLLGIRWWTPMRCSNIRPSLRYVAQAFTRWCCMPTFNLRQFLGKLPGMGASQDSFVCANDSWTWSLLMRLRPNADPLAGLFSLARRFFPAIETTRYFPDTSLQSQVLPRVSWPWAAARNFVAASGAHAAFA